MNAYCYIAHLRFCASEAVCISECFAIASRNLDSGCVSQIHGSVSSWFLAYIKGIVDCCSCYQYRLSIVYAVSINHRSLHCSLVAIAERCKRALTFSRGPGLTDRNGCMHAWTLNRCYSQPVMLMSFQASMARCVIDAMGGWRDLHVCTKCRACVRVFFYGIQ